MVHMASFNNWMPSPIQESKAYANTSGIRFGVGVEDVLDACGMPIVFPISLCQATEQQSGALLSQQQFGIQASLSC